MKQLTALSILAFLLYSCNSVAPAKQENEKSVPIEGTWALQSAATITKGDTVTTDYTKTQEMIKIINATHFSFLKHNLKNAKDTAFFEAGGGRYELTGNQYTEHLDYCNFREWEGHRFPFTVKITNDTLLQSGIEKVENLGIDRLIIEKYVRVK